LSRRDRIASVILSGRNLFVGTRQSGRCFDCRARWRTSDSSGLVDRLFSSIAVDVHFEDRSVMDEAVDGGERHGGVGEDLAPFAERLVGGDQQRSTLIACAYQLEQDAGSR